MERNEFDVQAAKLIRRNWRHMDDLGGQPPAALLDGLWGIVQAHAADAGVIAVKREDDAPTAEQVATWIRDHPAELAKMARVAGGMDKLMAIGTGTAAPRRTTRRSTPK